MPPACEELELLRAELARERAAREQLEAHLQALGQITREPAPFSEARAGPQRKHLQQAWDRPPNSCIASTNCGSVAPAIRTPMPRVLLQPPRRVL